MAAVRLAWSVLAGGLDALPHQHGYSALWGKARHQAYVTGLPGRGLWTDLGTFRHPGSARKACRLVVEAVCHPSN